MTDQLLAALVAQAKRGKPRFFAICGVYEYPPGLDDEDAAYVEWGLEFPDRAVTWSPGSLTISGSAEEILMDHAKLGPARLVWFDVDRSAPWV